MRLARYVISRWLKETFQEGTFSKLGTFVLDSDTWKVSWIKLTVKRPLITTSSTSPNHQDYSDARSKSSVDFFDSVSIHILLYLVYWAILHLTEGILSVFFLWAGRVLVLNYFQLVIMFLVFFFFMEFFSWIFLEIIYGVAN